MKIKEIHIGLSGVIPTSSYENLRPSYDMTVELTEEDNTNDVFIRIEKELKQRFDLMANRAKADLIEKQYQSIRFYEEGGKKYPSVTSVLNWDKEWSISEDHLRQYAARGTVVHKLLELYFNDKKWYDPKDLSEIKEEVSILLSGSLCFSWTDCSYKAFMEQYGKDIEIEESEKRVINNEQLYAGRYDIKGKYKGIPSIMDFKTGNFYDMRQLAAYAACEKGIEQLVILPVGPTDNKCGYKKPIICDTITQEYKEFCKARAKFRERFGI